jgi:cellulose synthase/poly-beta-1,6-N-acetylglucosamine synthase-like glycosyltransferase
MAERDKTISVIIPVEPDGNINKAMDALHKIDYPQELVEIIVARGRNPSVQRNTALRYAHGEIVYFLDSDSIADRQLFKIVANYYNDLNAVHNKIAGIGGPSITPGSDTLLQKCFGYVLGSLLTGLKSRCRYRSMGPVREAGEEELILCNLSIRKKVLEEEGGFNERLYPNEENELINRLREKGYRFIYHPEAIVYRSQRRTIAKYIKQIFCYGRGRAEQMLIVPSNLNIPRFAPLIFCGYLISMILIRNPVYFSVLYLYLILIIASTISIMIRESQPLVIRILPGLFFVTHVCYGLGLFWGFVKTLFKHKRKQELPIIVEELKI